MMHITLIRLLLCRSGPHLYGLWSGCRCRRSWRGCRRVVMSCQSHIRSCQESDLIATENTALSSGADGHCGHFSAPGPEPRPLAAAWLVRIAPISHPLKAKPGQTPGTRTDCSPVQGCWSVVSTPLYQRPRVLQTVRAEPGGEDKAHYTEEPGGWHQSRTLRKLTFTQLACNWLLARLCCCCCCRGLRTNSYIIVAGQADGHCEQVLLCTTSVLCWATKARQQPWHILPPTTMCAAGCNVRRCQASSVEIVDKQQRPCGLASPSTNFLQTGEGVLTSGLS